MKQYFLFSVVPWAAMLLMAKLSVAERDPTNGDGQGQHRRLVKAELGKMAKVWSKRLVQGGEPLESIFNCVGSPDQSRWRHEEPLKRDEYLCSQKNNYVFGLTSYGDLVWVNVEEGKIKKYFDDPSLEQSDVETEYFQLSRQGELQLYDKDDNLIWEQAPKVDGIDEHRCISDYSCPYFHLHSDGVNVLNFIDPETNAWIPKNMNKAYNF